MKRSFDIILPSPKLPKEFTKRDHIVEILSAVLLALATVGSSWSAYQATRWGGLQAVYFGTAAAQRNESVRNTTIANRKLTIDVGLFVEYLAAISLRNDTFAGFLRKRFPPRLKTAVDAWIETKPFKNPDAPVSPFVMDEYHIEEEQEASRFVKRAEEDFDKARQANQTGDNYVLLTVIFASVLFFAGVGMKFESFSLRVTMLSLATVALVVTVAVLSGFPVH